MIKWFAANKLVLNFDKIDIMNMWNKYIMEYWSIIVGYLYVCGYNEIHNKELMTFHIMNWLLKKIEEMVHIKFLDLQIENHLSWKNYTE